VRVLRTPDERFAHLADFPYEPAHASVGDDLRMAYVQAGPADGPPVILLHGEPTWSYLWRSVIPPLAEAGCRVIAPDLIGFGRSDKPAEVADLVAFLASDSAAYISGQVISINGGML